MLASLIVGRHLLNMYLYFSEAVCNGFHQIRTKNPTKFAIIFFFLRTHTHILMNANQARSQHSRFDALKI